MGLDAEVFCCNAIEPLIFLDPLSFFCLSSIIDVGIFSSCVFMLTNRGKKKILSSDHEKVLKYKLSVAFGETWKDRGGLENQKKQINKFKEMVIQCCENEKLVSYFPLKRHIKKQYIQSRSRSFQPFCAQYLLN